MNKFWNGKLKGILGFCILILSILFNKVFSTLGSILLLNNINSSGKGCRIMSKVKYRYPSKINMGNHVVIGEGTAMISEIAATPGLFIEDGVSIGASCTIDFSGGITIREHAHVAHNVLISTHDHGYDYRSEPTGKPLNIGKNAFIGSNSIIMHNVNDIGENAVIGTGAIVTKDVPKNAVVAGNPAKILRYIE